MKYELWLWLIGNRDWHRDIKDRIIIRLPVGIEIEIEIKDNQNKGWDDYSIDDYNSEWNNSSDDNRS